MKACRRKYIEWGAAGIGALALFLFFFRILPYHLFHREQTQLFLLATEPLAGYLRHPAALARLSGDFLTQFFYYEGGGPAIMAVVLLLWGNDIGSQLQRPLAIAMISGMSFGTVVSLYFVPLCYYYLRTRFFHQSFA